MVHKVSKKLAMAYRVYLEFPFKKGMWFPMLEQRRFIEDAKNDQFMMEMNPILRKAGVKTKIVQEPAEYTEMLERRLFKKLGMERPSKLRGALESLLVFY
jgi:hypothetical protein